jgi:hypothetical protein
MKTNPIFVSTIKKKNIMTNSISITDFSFQFTGHGHYKVSYTYPSGKTISATINHMPLIDCTKNSDEPKKKDLIDLKNTIKYNN